MYGRFYGFAFDNRWIGHVTQTKHRNTRLEYRASEIKRVKWVERKGLACKTMTRNFPKNLSLLTSPRSVLSGKKQIATTKNGCNTYYYGKRIGMSM
jgi:hypothetical protein